MVIAWVLVAVLCLLIATFALPIDVRIEVETVPQLRYRVAVRAWFGGLRYAWSGPARKARPASASRGPAVESRRRGRRRWAGSSVTSRAFLDALRRLIHRVLGSARLQQASVALRFGFDDPAATAEVFGYLCALEAGLAALPVRHAVRPDFEGEVFALELAATVRVFCLRMVRAVCVFLMQPVVWRAIHERERRVR